LITAAAAFPIGLAIFLLVVLRWPAIRAMPVCAAVTAATSYAIWQAPVVRVAAAVVEASWITASILFIVFGAMFFLALLRATGAIAVLQRSVATLSNDARIQAVLVGWSLGSFLEGAAGFGTPAAITAPLLIGLGFRPVQALMVALIGDSTAVSFGAIGTPMIIGMGEGLATADPGITTPSIEAIAERVATFDLVLGTVMPCVLVMALVLSQQSHDWWRLALRALPFAACVGFSQAAASWVVVRFLGVEFPSLIGPLAGFLTALFLLRSGLLVPRDVWRMENAAGGFAMESAPRQCAEPTRVAAFAPFALLLFLLTLTRIRALPLGGWLSSASLGMEGILGTNISASFEPLVSPGMVFVACSLLSVLWLPGGWPVLKRAGRHAGFVTMRTSIALFAAIVMVRIFIHSDGNTAGLESMPRELAASLQQSLGGFWPLMAPWVGALGSFVSGSATFSNMMFALLQWKIAVTLDHSPVTILALQSIGAAAGNMVCIHNVVAACAVAGAAGEEGRVILRTALPMVIYLLIACSLATLA